MTVEAGINLIEEGDPGDRFYVIRSGSMTATFKGQPLSQMGPGDPFGELVKGCRDLGMVVLARTDPVAGRRGMSASILPGGSGTPRRKRPGKPCR